MDGNCIGYAAKREQLRVLQEVANYNGEVIYAIPDPHIEYWYLLDPDACQAAIETNNTPRVPTYKCEKDVYKNALKAVITDSGVDPAFGGAEYGKDIVANMNLYLAEQNDPRHSLKAFLSDLRAALVPYASSQPTA